MQKYKKYFSTLGVIAFMLLVSSALASGEVEWSSPVTVKTNAWNSFGARTSNGNYVIAVQTGSNAIIAQAYNTSGTNLWTTTVQFDSANLSEVVADGSGGAFILYTMNNDGYTDGYLARVSSTGDVQWTFNNFDHTANVNELWPRVIHDGNNGAFVTWYVGNSSYKPRMTHINSSGVVPAGWNTGSGEINRPVDLTSTYSNERPEPRLIISDAGKVIVARDENGQIKVSKYDTDGTQLWLHDAGGTGTLTYFQAEPDGNNGVYVATWRRNGTNYELYVTDYTSAGTNSSWSPKLYKTVATNANIPENLVSASDSTGNLYLGWDEQVNYENDAYVQKIDHSGDEHWGTGGKLLGTLADGEENYFENMYLYNVPHTIVSDGLGGAIVGLNRMSSAVPSAVVGQRISPDGTLLWGDTGQIFTPDPNNDWDYQQDVLSDGNGGAVMDWYQNNSSQIVAQYVRTAAPAVPTNLHATYSGSINLTWDAADGATSYNVYRSDDNGASYFIENTSTSNSFNDRGGIAYHHTYYYKISAVNERGESAQSNTSFVDVELAPPTNLTATGADNSVRLAWTANTEAQWYNIYRSDTDGGPYSQIDSSISDTSYTDSTAVNGTEYFYVVRSYGSETESGNSNQVSVTPTAFSYGLGNLHELSLNTGYRRTAVIKTTDNNFVVVWAGTDNHILVQKIEASTGFEMWTTGGIVLSDQLNSNYIYAIPDNNNGVYIAYDGSDSYAHAQHLDSDGAATWGTNGIQLLQNESRIDDMKKDGAGGVYVSTGNDTGGYVYHFDPDGTMVTMTITPNDYLLMSEPDTSGDVFVGGTEDSSNIAYVVKLSPSGVVTDWGNNGQMSMFSNQSDWTVWDPALISDGNGGVIIVTDAWDSVHDVEATNGIRIDGSGNRSWEGVNLGTDYPWFGQIIKTGNSTYTFLATVYDDASGQDKVRAVQFDADGTPGTTTWLYDQTESSNQDFGGDANNSVYDNWRSIYSVFGSDQDHDIKVQRYNKGDGSISLGTTGTTVSEGGLNDYSTIADNGNGQALIAWRNRDSSSPGVYNVYFKLLNYEQSGGGGSHGDAPTNVRATPGDSQITLNWDSMLFATGYNVYAFNVMNILHPYTLINTGGPISENTYTVTPLVNGMSKTYVVTAIYEAGESGYSDSVSATPAVGLTPALSYSRPAIGPTSGNTDVTLIGHNFQDNPRVQFGNHDATNVSLADELPDSIAGSSGEDIVPLSFQSNNYILSGNNLYKWITNLHCFGKDDTSACYTPSQTLSVDLRGWKIFTSGADKYFVGAEWNTAGHVNLYKWISDQNCLGDGTTCGAALQNFDSYNAHQVEIMPIGSDIYMTYNFNMDDSSNTDLPNAIYKWMPDGNASLGCFGDGTTCSTAFQTIETNNNRGWKGFTIGSDSYLALSQAYGTDTLYKWIPTGNSGKGCYGDGSTCGSSFQSFGQWGMAVTAFSIDSDQFLVLGEIPSDTTMNYVYKWIPAGNSGAGCFGDGTTCGTALQTLSAQSGDENWTYGVFNINSTNYLMLASRNNSSPLYKWMSGSSCFGDGADCGTAVQLLATSGFPLNLNEFSIDTNNYLAVYRHDDNPSIYRWNSYDSCFIDNSTCFEKEITARTPSNGSGPTDITVTNTDMQSDTLTNGFTYTGGGGGTCTAGSGESCGQITIGCNDRGSISLSDVSPSVSFQQRTSNFYQDSDNASLAAPFYMDITDTRGYDAGSGNCGTGATLSIQSSGLSYNGYSLDLNMDSALTQDSITCPGSACEPGPAHLSDVATTQGPVGSILHGADILNISEAFAGTIRLQMATNQLVVVKPAGPLPKGTFSGVITVTLL